MDHAPDQPDHTDHRHAPVHHGRPRQHRHPVRTAAVVAALAVVVGGGAGTALAASSATATVAAHAPERRGDTGGSQQPTATTGTPATTQQQTGVVDVDTVLDYGTGEAAGTGIVLTPGGEILTNNHVIQGSTAITVTDVATGSRYTATVVGSDATDDVAVLQLRGASGLTPAVLATPAAQAAVAPGTAVTAVGNAGGAGGTPSAATGSVLALGQDITAGDETAASSEDLHGLIEVGASVLSGDSGGPLYANGAVIGMDTAASQPSGPRYRTTADASNASTTGYAIPIGAALRIAGQITSGVDDGTVTQGYPAVLGVEVASGGGSGAAESAAAADGAEISGVLRGSPAASAGLSPGDVVTSVDGTPVTDANGLSAALKPHKVGDQVQLGWVDASGNQQSATVTLVEGPAA